MKIKEILSQYRRDIVALLICEHCNHEEKRNGYDDAYFHQNVIPDMECGKCGKKADPETYRAYAPKYSDNQTV